MQGGTQHLIDRVGCFTPKRVDLSELGPGEIGFITAQIKEVEQAKVGDTITTVKQGAPAALPGYKEVQSVVFCGLRSEEHTSVLQSLMRNSYAVFCLHTKNTHHSFT